jgi:carboxypeptidase PM20D1
MIGMAEKGYAEIRLSVTDKGGHAAEPPKHTALGKLAAAITAIEGKPMKPRIIPPVDLTLRTLGRYMKLPIRLLLANTWLFKPVLCYVLASTRHTQAMVRTTIAATMCEASPAANVLPQRASAVLNVRILPGETAEDAVNHICRRTKKAGFPCEVTILKASEPVAMNPPDGVYDTLVRCLPALGAPVIPVPYLVTGATDSHEYTGITGQIYRFYPFALSKSELAAMHATDERLRLQSLAGALRFNYHFIKEAGGKG